MGAAFYQKYAMILVTGATGTVGRQLIQMLLDRGASVRALCRNATKANLPKDVEIHVGSLDETDALDEAFKGVERAFSLTIGHNLPAHAENLVKVGKRNDLRHVVLMSSLANEMEGENPLKREHEAAEKSYMRAGLGWTLLRGGVFASNTRQWIPGIRAAGVVRNVLRNDACACIDPHDIATVAATVLTSDTHFGKIYGLTGPESITPEEQVATLAELRGKPIEFIQLSEAQAAEYFRTVIFPHISSSGSEREAMDLLRTLRHPRLPWLTPRPDVQQVTGRRARTFREWAQDHTAAFC